MAVLLGIGAVAHFFDTLGVGSFATTTAALRLGRLMDDEDLPGTLNVGHAIPTISEAIIFIALLGGLIDRPTIVSMVIAGGIGAWFGAGIVANWPRQKIQRAMAIALVRKTAKRSTSMSSRNSWSTRSMVVRLSSRIRHRPGRRSTCCCRFPRGRSPF